MINPFGAMNLVPANLLGQQNPLFGQGQGLNSAVPATGSGALDPTALLGQQNPMAMLGLDGTGSNGLGMDLMQMLQMLLSMLSPGMDPMMASGASPMFGGGDSAGNPYESFLGGGGGGGGYSGGGGGGGGGVRSVSSSGGGYSGGGSVSSSGGSSVLDPGLTDQEASPGAYEMLKRAGGMVGLHEGRDRAEISKITGKSGINPATTPWCAAFAMNLLEEHKLLNLDGLSNRNYTPTIKDWAQKKNIYGDRGEYKPKPGDAIMFDWQGKGRADVEHIGLVEKVKNGKVYTIEGNSSDSVKRRVYDLNDPNIDGYVVTKGTKKKSPAEAKPEPKPAPQTEPKPQPKNTPRTLTV